jgi:hypothetical protein
MAEATRQEWPVKFADLIVEIHKTVQISKVDGKTALPARRLGEHQHDVLRFATNFAIPMDNNHV